MKISVSWLKDRVSSKLSAKEIGDQLTLAGLEVETIEPAGPAFRKNTIVVGEVLSTEPHPDANKLKVCQVNVGKKQSLVIVCGAANVRPGIRVPVALVRAKVGELEIKRAEIRGVTSNGMLCSGAELGLEEQSSGLMELDARAPIGQDIQEYLALGDEIIEVDLTPNRGDCLSMTGVAREVAALASGRLKKNTIAPVKAMTKEKRSVTLDAPEACARYTGRAMTGIDISAPTPDWMKERIRRSGSRSINAVVDVTNYVMLELGQPMHAFDLSKIEGGIHVRMAKKAEPLTLLDGSALTLQEDNLVIADDKKAIALAGIMGGQNTAVSDETQDIYLESAFFAPAAIIGKARRIGMHTDASHRYERGVDSELQLMAMERATALILKICGGAAGPITHSQARKQLPKQRPIRLYKDQIPRILGVSIPDAKVASMLKALGMSLEKAEGGWKVTAPSWRFDISAEHDLIEEIGRCHGIDNIEPRMPSVSAVQGRNAEARIDDVDLRRQLIGLGYHEVMTYSFVDPAIQQQLFGKTRSVKLSNPIADNMAVMRVSMWPGLLDAVKNNVNRQEHRIRFFEVGHVFTKGTKSGVYQEKKHLAGVISGVAADPHWSRGTREVDFFDLKGDLEAVLALSDRREEITIAAAAHHSLHPGQSAGIYLGRKVIGHIGRLHPEHESSLGIDQPVYLFEVDCAVLQQSTVPSFIPISRYPSVERDLAVVVDVDRAVGEIFDTIRSSAGKLLKNLELFDVYEGERIEKGKKSFAFSLTFQSESSNLTSLEVDEITESVLDSLRDRHGAVLRS